MFIQMFLSTLVFFSKMPKSLRTKWKGMIEAALLVAATLQYKNKVFLHE